MNQAVLCAAALLALPASVRAMSPSEIAHHINNMDNAPFTAHDSSHYADTYGDSLMAHYPDMDRLMPHFGVEGVNATALPESYDFRKEYGHCESPTKVFNQGKCGGCWALSVAGALSDRFCRASVDVVLSPQDLLDCVEGHSKGCNGGYTEDGFDYVNDEGMRSEACVPFTALDGYCNDNACATAGASNQRYYTKTWAQYIPSDEAAIKQELATHGSISAVFEVFEDFFQYKSGVYRHLTGEYAGLHAVVIVGWGTDQTSGADYWIVKNSWGTEFGEDQGFFRVARGLKVNGCNMEGALTAALPQVDAALPPVEATMSEI